LPICQLHHIPHKGALHSSAPHYRRSSATHSAPSFGLMKPRLKLPPNGQNWQNGAPYVIWRTRSLVPGRCLLRRSWCMPMQRAGRSPSAWNHTDRGVCQWSVSFRLESNREGGRGTYRAKVPALDLVQQVPALFSSECTLLHTREHCLHGASMWAWAALHLLLLLCFVASASPPRGVSGGDLFQLCRMLNMLSHLPLGYI
jgi:hypothetical protein